MRSRTADSTARSNTQRSRELSKNGLFLRKWWDAAMEKARIYPRIDQRVQWRNKGGKYRYDKGGSKNHQQSSRAGEI